jgi:hypothetical protein
VTWQPLSVREGRRQPDGPWEGVPPHLRFPLRHWLEGVYGYRSKSGMRPEVMLAVAASLRLELPYTLLSDETMNRLIQTAEANDDLYLDMLDTCLRTIDFRDGAGPTLKATLEAAGSVWTVADNNRSLMRRVSSETQQALDRAATPADRASAELREAWSAVLARNPDSAKAWGHAIVAIEELSIPLVVPSQAKPNLGHVIGQLDKQGALWKLALHGADGSQSVEPLVCMLRLMWPNPGRHGGAVARPISVEEAQDVVHLAVTIVQWLRTGALSKR